MDIDLEEDIKDAQEALQFALQELEQAKQWVDKCDTELKRLISQRN